MESAVNGIRMHYEVAGDGPAVVLVHGLAASLAFWYLGVVPVLSRRFRVVSYDLRGHGLSDMPPSGYALGDLADDLAGLLDRLGVRSVDLVAHSLGAAVALRLAARDPARVNRLLLADAVIPQLRAGRTRRPEQLSLRQLVQLGELGGGPRGTQRHPLNGAAGSSERWRRLLATTTAPTELAGRGLTAGALRRIEQPALVLAGERSRVLTTSRRVAALLPHAHLELVPGAGHFHPLARPAEFARRADAFLTTSQDHAGGA